MSYYRYMCSNHLHSFTEAVNYVILFQEEKVTLSSTVEKFQSELHKIESEKGELLADNQRMAELLAVSEGESQVMEGLIEERRSLQRQCKQLRDNGESPYYSRQSELQLLGSL